MTGFRGKRRTRIFTPGLSEVPRPPSILARPTAGGSTHPAPPARSNSALADPEGTPYSRKGGGTQGPHSAPPAVCRLARARVMCLYVEPAVPAGLDEVARDSRTGEQLDYDRCRHHYRSEYKYGPVQTVASNSALGPVLQGQGCLGFRPSGRATTARRRVVRLKLWERRRPQRSDLSRPQPSDHRCDGGRDDERDRCPSRTRSAPRRAALPPDQCCEQLRPGQNLESQAFSTDSPKSLLVRATELAALTGRTLDLLARLRRVHRSSRAERRGPVPAAAPQPGRLPTSGCRG
jgi:hypothetical protein